MLIMLSGFDPRDFLSSYLERRSKAMKKAAKARLAGDSSLDDRASEYAGSNAAINVALRNGFASVAIDGTCRPTDVSIRNPDGQPIGHLPANMIDADVHSRILEEGGKLAGIEIRVT